jgi:hypothetical protein
MARGMMIDYITESSQYQSLFGRLFTRRNGMGDATWTRDTTRLLAAIESRAGRPDGQMHACRRPSGGMLLMRNRVGFLIWASFARAFAWVAWFGRVWPSLRRCCDVAATRRGSQYQATHTGNYISARHQYLDAFLIPLLLRFSKLHLNLRSA